MTTTTKLNILIVGGGLGGLSAAIACLLAGHTVEVLEQAAALGEVGAGIQLTPNVTRLLRRWGLFPALEPTAVKPGNIYLRRWETGEPIGLTRLVPDFELDFGAPYWVVHRAHLHDALVKRMQALGGVIHVDARVVGIDFDKRSVTTAAGRTYSADLIVGCDGLKSVTRAAFLGDRDVGPQETPFCAYRSTVDMDLLLADPELHPLVEKPDLSLWIGHDRHVMSYPISGGKTFNMVLSHPDTGSNPETQEEVLQEMRDNYAGWDKR
jgi:salicylate hydroxylase